MRQGLKTALTFTAGVAVGAVVWGGIQMHSFMKALRQFESASTNQDVLNLQLLSSEKRTGLLRESMLESLPELARRADLHRDDPEQANILWNIRLAYVLNDRAVPQEIEEILSNLPADSAPTCPMPRRELGLPPLPAPETPRTSATNNAQL